MRGRELVEKLQRSFCSARAGLLLIFFPHCIPFDSASFILGHQYVLYFSTLFFSFFCLPVVLLCARAAMSPWPLLKAAQLEKFGWKWLVPKGYKGVFCKV